MASRSSRNYCVLTHIWAGFAVLAVFLTTPREAQASPPPPAAPTWEWRQHDLRQLALRIRYSEKPGVRGCGGEAALRSTLRAAYGYDIFTPVPPGLPLIELPYELIELTITPAGGLYRATLRFLDAAGEPAYETRSFEEPPSACPRLLQIAALAVQIANAATMPRLPSVTPPPAYEEPPPRERPASPPSKERAPESAFLPERASGVPPLSNEAIRPRLRDDTERSALDRPPLTFIPGAGFGVAFGLGPNLAVGPALTGKVHWTRYSLLIEFRPLFPLRAQVGSKLESPALLMGNAGPCIQGGHFYGCALIHLGMLLLRASEATVSPASISVPVAAGGGRAGFDVPISQDVVGGALTFGMYAEGGIHLIKNAIELVEETSSKQVWAERTGFVAGGLSLSLRL